MTQTQTLTNWTAQAQEADRMTIELHHQERQAFRSHFLSLSTWAGVTATDLELQYALYHWRQGQTPESAVDTLKRRRGAVAAGEVRKLFRAQDEQGEKDD